MIAVKQVEDNLDKEKWIMINKAMIASGAGNYPNVFLQKKHKEFVELIKSGNANELLEAIKKDAKRHDNGEDSGFGYDKAIKEEDIGVAI